MNKKPFNEIEEQIKASAEGWEPPFDEASWEHMEQMLDNRDDRRRPIVWWVWLFPLLIGGAVGGFLYLGDKEKKDDDRNNKISTTKNIENKLNPNAVPGDMQDTTGFVNTEKAIPGNVVEPIASTTAASVNDVAVRPPLNATTAAAKMRTSISSPLITEDVMVSIAARDQKKKQAPAAANISINAAAPSDTINQNEKVVATNADTASFQAERAKEAAPVSSVIIKNKKLDSTKNKETALVAEAAPEEDKRSGSLSRFYFSLSGGIDGSGVDFPGLNKFAPRAGVTVGYHLNKNLSVAAGFFAGNKKYLAGKNDYKAKAGSYWAMVDIKEVDANCRVFEIPLWLRYDFSSNKSLRPFAMLGISSFIMDKEDYEYYYYRSGNPYWAEHSYKGNRHLFSVVRLAGGIEKKVSDNFFLSVQPGFAIPLAGVGEGQVKLYSTELLIGLKYRPFKKTK